MKKKQEEFMQELLADFMIEAAEHHQAIVTGLLELENNQDRDSQQHIIEKTFREIHSLKGAARAVNLLEIEHLCQGLESVFSQLKQQSITVSKFFFDTFHSAMDLLGQYLSDPANQKKSVSADKMVSMLNEVQALCNGNDTRADAFAKSSGGKQYLPVNLSAEPKTEYKPISAAPQDYKAVNPPAANKELSEAALQNMDSRLGSPDIIGHKETVRISSSKLTDFFIQAEELITFKSMFGYDLHELNRIGRLLSNKNRGLSLQDDQFKMALETQIKTLNDDIQLLTKNLDQHYRIFSRTVDDVLFRIKNALLLPFSEGLEWLPKFVRDLSKDLKKEVQIAIEGSEMEIDRRILEKIKDPLIHLIRNCIDHGIETPEQRLKQNKPPAGKISFKIIQQKSREITIILSDDGAGIDRKKVIQASLKAGIISSEKALNMSDDEVYNLIFYSGISTSPFITDLSGHGLGLAIVAESVSLLGGSIKVDTVPFEGTTFTIILPVTLLTFRGILIRLGEHHFVVPTKSVDRAIRFKSSEIKSVENKDTINVDGVAVGIMWLSKMLDLSTKTTLTNRNELFHALLIHSGQRKIVFVVDAILDEQEGVIKSLGSQLVNVRNVSGATLLGDGRIVPILNTTELIENLINTSSMSIANNDLNDEENDKQKQTILVADDSITSRSLIRNIIESAGYNVKTAVDGVEAFSLLQGEHFDMVVTDVEMPRMNGFDLTTKIRNDKNFNDLPVILVTALELPSDKQRGMECGANAYIVKSSFEQSNLVDAISRLI
ncbi:MAG: response regulator [Bacteroidota bacterium]|nr:response regulator [Bacteroidota bacterium]